MSTTSNPLESIKNIVTDALTPSSKGTEDAATKPSEEHLISPTAQESKDKLERLLKERPEKSDLVDKNILKGGNTAPALQAAQAELERARLEDKLEHALQSRPKPEELVREGILQEGEAPPS